jgi:hypothetical protein
LVHTEWHIQSNRWEYTQLLQEREREREREKKVFSVNFKVLSRICFILATGKKQIVFHYFLACTDVNFQSKEEKGEMSNMGTILGRGVDGA